MSFAQAERRAFCDALAVAGAEAPTLCEGWDAHDLAAHIWVRENDPIGAPGMIMAQLAEVTEKRTDAVRRRWTFDELIQQIRRGPRALSPFKVPILDELANTAEFFVHTEDVRRPAGLPPRRQTPDFEDAIASTLIRMGKTLMKRAASGVVLERSDTGETLRVSSGANTITVVGLPTELLLFVFGRMQDADVRLIGEDADVDELLANHRGF